MKTIKGKIETLSREYEAKRERLIGEGAFYYGHPELRALIRRIDALRAELND